MYEPSEEFARLYEALILFQTRALGYAMNGESADERLERAHFVVDVIAKANNKFNRRCPEPLMIKLSTHCAPGLVNCGGVCIDPRACWGRSSSAKDDASRDDAMAEG